MTEEVSTETFYDIPVRIVNSNGTPMIPLVDIASALNYDRSNMTRLLKRNVELFEPYKALVQMTTPGGQQELVCLSESGVAGLLIKLDYSRVKDKTFRKKVMEFQQWAIEILTKAIRQELVTAYAQRKDTPVDIINEQLDIADIAINRSGVSKEIAHGMAWSLASKFLDNDLTSAYATFIRSQGNKELVNKLLEPGESYADKAEYDSYFSLKKMAEFLKKSPDKVRNELEDQKIIYSENNIWHLTRLGERYGKIFMITPGFPFSSKQRAYIKYNPDAVALLRKAFDSKQEALTAGV